MSSTCIEPKPSRLRIYVTCCKLLATGAMSCHCNVFDKGRARAQEVLVRKLASSGKKEAWPGPSSLEVEMGSFLTLDKRQGASYFCAIKLEFCICSSCLGQWNRRQGVARCKSVVLHAESTRAYLGTVVFQECVPSCLQRRRLLLIVFTA